jgi:hypothetical protein
MIGQAGLGVGYTLDPSANQVIVTAVATASGQLKLISWRPAEDGLSIARLNDSGGQGGTADLLDLAVAAFGFCVTATRGTNGKLQIVVWKLNPSTGEITRTSDDGGSEGAVGEIAMAQSPLGDGRVIIAVSDGAGNLVLKNWEVDQFGKLHRRGDTAIQGNGAGQATNLTIRSLSNGRVLTAVRTGSGNLKLIVWRIHKEGKVERLGDSGSEGEAVSVISLATIDDDRVVTAVRDSGNNLRVIGWHVSADGMTVTRAGDSGNAAGGADRMATIFHAMSGPTPEFPLDEGDPILLTVVRTKRSTLKLIRWRLKQQTLQRLTGDFGDNTGAVERIAHIVKLRNNVYLVPIRDGDGRLRLVTYKLDDAHQPAVLPDTLLLYDKSMFENTVRVVPPTLGECLHGSIVLHLGQPRATAGFAYRDLLDSNGAFPASAPLTRVPYPFNSEQSNGTDNQIIRLDDGALLALKNGYTWSTVTPKPAWFDTVPMNSGMSPHGRNALFILRSSNCGHSWSILSVIDAAVIAGGKYGWPQQSKDDGTWWVGGFDRTEMYQDSWTKAVFVSGHGDTNYVLGGKSVVNHAAVIFRSDDRGGTWSLFEEHAEWGRQPYVMSSTPNWPLLVLMEVGTEPHLFALKKGSSSLDGGHSVAAVSVGKGIPVGRDSGVADVGSNLGSPLCIARIEESDQVRIAYPSVDADGRQGYEICNVTLAAGGDHVVDRIARIEAIDPSEASCTLGSFSRDDAISPKNVAMMFSWIEAPPSTSPDKDKLLARGKVFFGATGEYESKTLSVAAGSPAPFSRLAIGHYVTSAGFHHGGKAHFLAQWSVKDSIRGNIVSMP